MKCGGKMRVIAQELFRCEKCGQVLSTGGWAWECQAEIEEKIIIKTRLSMKKLLTLCLLVVGFATFAQKPKNVIMMIPDGTSHEVVTLARWYNGGQLNLDALVCGMSITTEVDSVITDSAPGGTALATGTKTIGGYVGVDRDTLPLISVLELARVEKGMKTGMVVTCRFPHATPADFVSHYINRRKYEVLANQFAFNSPDVMFGGGLKYFVENPNITLYDAKTYQSAKWEGNKKIWALFSKDDMPYACDKVLPRPEETVAKALELLQGSKNGFFLMVEGSEVDFGAHSHDPYAAITEFLEFDKAIGKALEFAKKDGNTLVVICPDHGNGALTMKNGGVKNGRYTTNVVTDIIEPLKQHVKKSTKWIMEQLLASSDTTALKTSIFNNYWVEVTGKEIQDQTAILKATTDKEEIDKIEAFFGDRLSTKLNLNWGTLGHTNEDVFLAVYAPKGTDKLTGVVDNTAIAPYISKFMGTGDLALKSKKYFNPIKTPKNNLYPCKNHEVKLFPNTNYYTFDGLKIELKSLIINSGKVGTLFVPREFFENMNQSQ